MMSAQHGQAFFGGPASRGDKMSDTDEDRSIYIEKVNGLEAARKKKDAYLAGKAVRIRSLSDFESVVVKGDYTWRVDLINDTVTMALYDGAIAPEKLRARLYFAPEGEPVKVDAISPSGGATSLPCDEVIMDRSRIEFRSKSEPVYSFARP